MMTIMMMAAAMTTMINCRSCVLLSYTRKYRVIRKCLRNVRTLRNIQDRHSRKELSSACEVGHTLGVSLPLLTCSPSAWPSRLLYRRGRTSRRDLWITLYLVEIWVVSDGMSYVCAPWCYHNSKHQVCSLPSKPLWYSVLHFFVLFSLYMNFTHDGDNFALNTRLW
jgi:hypothetical protein